MNAPTTIEAEDFTALILNLDHDYAEHRARLAAINAKFDAHAARIDELCDEWSEYLGDAYRPVPATPEGAEPPSRLGASPRITIAGEAA